MEGIGGSVRVNRGRESDGQRYYSGRGQNGRKQRIEERRGPRIEMEMQKRRVEVKRISRRNGALGNRRGDEHWKK